MRRARLHLSLMDRPGKPCVRHRMGPIYRSCAYTCHQQSFLRRIVGTCLAFVLFFRTHLKIGHKQPRTILFPASDVLPCATVRLVFLIAQLNHLVLKTAKRDLLAPNRSQMLKNDRNARKLDLDCETYFFGMVAVWLL